MMYTVPACLLFASLQDRPHMQSLMNSARCSEQASIFLVVGAFEMFINLGLHTVMSQQRDS